jgi:putative tryptophan/tyrosine transport system substrate-binding protein
MIPGGGQGGGPLRRRAFVAALGIAALARPGLALAQQREATRRIAVLSPTAENDPESAGLGAAFRRALEQFGWTGGRNLRIEYRWGGGDANKIQADANALVAMQPEVIMAVGAPAVVPLLRATKTIPIIFVSASDPVAQGFVTNLAHPGGNVTGFTNFDASMGAVWLGLLREVAPRLNRVAVLYNPTTAPYTGSFIRSVQGAAAASAVTVTDAPVHDEDEIDRAIASIGKAPDGGLLVPSDAFTYTHFGEIVARAAQFRLPAIYAFRVFASSGGLISYGVDLTAQMKQAAGYIDRILFGTSPGDLPVQAPTKFRLVLNKKTALAMGVTFPPTLIARADEVIE